MESSQFEGIEDTLLISIPDSGEKDGLALLEKGKLFRFDIPGCTGLWQAEDTLYVALMTSEYMLLRIYEPGKEVKTIISSQLSDVHDIRLIGDDLYVVSTGTNEVAIVDKNGRITKSWKMPGYGDASHINCLDVWDERLVATAFGNFSTYRGYKGRSKGSGIVLDVKTQEVVSNGLSSPHTPRRDEEGGVYICDSGSQRLTYNKNGSEKVLHFPGAFPRGLAITKETIYCGLSSLRHRQDISSARFSAITSAQLVVVDKEKLTTTRQIALPQAEIYDIIAVLPSS